jgi:ribonuclease G
MSNDAHREQVVDELHKALKYDRIRTSQPVMTTLGLVELTRKKTRSMIDGILLRDCPYCNGDSYVFSEEYVIMRVRDELMSLFNEENPSSVLVYVHPDVYSKIFSIRYLESDCSTIWKGKRIYIIPKETLHAEHFEVKPDNSVILDLPDTARMLF